MKLLIVAGSPRIDSESTRVSRILESYTMHNSGFSPNVLDLSLHHTTDEVDTMTRQAEAFIIVVPEHSGMAPPILKNFFVSSEYPALAHKPALIVSISNSMGGSYPIIDLRSTTYKNTRICYLPDHIIIREVHTFNHDLSSPIYAGLGRRVAACVTTLELYTRQLSSVRAEILGVSKTITYGM